jgi:hypothetical protein
LREKWAKCSFCGAYNGLYGTEVKEHTSRCRYVGSANSKDIERPNYFKFIEEDDVNYLPLIHSQIEVLRLRKELSQLKNKIQKPE